MCPLYLPQFQTLDDTQGCISGSPCTAVRWVPLSSTLFLVSHADGTIIAYDKERDDGSFTAQDPTLALSPEPNPPSTPMTLDQMSSTQHGDWDPLDRIFVTMPPWHPGTAGSGLTTTPGKGEKEKVAKNPVSHWRISRRSVVG